MSRRHSFLGSLVGLIVLAVASVAQAVPITGNSGPGGFDVLTGSSDIVYHLDAATIGVGNGNPVSSWSDSGFFARTFTQGTAANRPILSSAGIGGKPAVNFDGAATPNADRLDNGTSLTVGSVIAVNKPDVLGGLRGIWGTTADVGVRQENATNWQHQGNGGDFTNPASSTFHVNGANTDAASTTNHILAATRGTTTTFANQRVGDYLAGFSRGYDGLVAELLVFDRQITATERQIIENHYSAEYSIALAAGDIYAGDTAGNGNFDNFVFGVANISGGSTLNAGMGGFGIEVTSLAASQSILAGTTASTASPLNTWYVDSSNPGTIGATFGFDLTGNLGLASRVHLGYRSALTGTTNHLFNVPKTLVGNTLTFAVPAATLVDGYFFLATPEPTTGLLLSLGLVAGVLRRRK